MWESVFEKLELPQRGILSSWCDLKRDKYFLFHFHLFWCVLFFLFPPIISAWVMQKSTNDLQCIRIGPTALLISIAGVKLLVSHSLTSSTHVRKAKDTSGSPVKPDGQGCPTLHSQQEAV